jgi:hypothetical protein
MQVCVLTVWRLLGESVLTVRRLLEESLLTVSSFPKESLLTVETSFERMASLRVPTKIKSSSEPQQCVSYGDSSVRL